MIDTVLFIAPFNIRIRSPFAAVARHIEFFYSDYQRADRSAFIDFDVEVLPGQGLRRWWRPQVRFLLDGIESFFPLPADQAAPMLEWGLNWCVAGRPLGFLVMHAAVLEKAGEALMMPGFPGAGKSTLCASLCLMNRWRLFSDELAILDPATNEMQPHPRPISLKNASVDIVSAFPESRLGPIYRDTRKGDISHAASPKPSIDSCMVPAPVRWVVFPRFDSEATPHCEEISRAEAFTLISEQSFNKERMGEVGFDALCAMLTGARCFQINYGSTEGGLRLIEEIANP